MKRLLALPLLLFLLTVGCIHPAPPSVRIDPVQTVLKSIVRLETRTPEGVYGCTAFSINVRVYLTAAHCVAPLNRFPKAKLRANGHSTLVLRTDPTLDLALLLTDIIKPALLIRDVPLTYLEQVKAVGYAYGLPYPLVTDHVVQAVESILAPGLYPGTVVMGGFIGGMSGGPIFDERGQVVGMVQQGDNQVGYGVSSRTLREFLKE